MKRTPQMRILILVMVASLSWVASAHGQATAQAPAAPRKPPMPRPQTPPVAETKASAPQVVTILHRLSGLKLLGLMARDDLQLKSIAQLDEAFKIMGEVHTNVIAGLALDDGQTIVAWLPDVQAEMPPPPPEPFAPRAPVAAEPPLPSQPKAPLPPEIAAQGVGFVQTPDLTVVGRGGKRLLAHYVGLDAASGLSILKLDDKDLLSSPEVKDNEVTVGQRLRLFAPEPAVASTFSGRVSVRVGETEGTITNVTQASSGSIYRVKVKAARLSSANIGSVAVNEAGETVGIIDAIDRGEASILPAELIRNAAKRVLKRQSSVPRPWLGVSGEPIASIAPERLLDNGWHEFQATALTQQRAGIMLTKVIPNSPAAVAELRPGDVILSVNGEHVRNAEDFSWFLEEAGPGGSVNFAVMHPGQSQTQAVNLRLSDVRDAAFFPKRARVGAIAFGQGSLAQFGIEAVALGPLVASRMGANGGSLVIFVTHESEAFKAGLRPGDIIQAIDGQQVSLQKPTATTPGKVVTFDVVRGRQHLTFTFANEPN